MYKRLIWIIYRTLANHLPDSEDIFGKPSKRFRAFLAKKIIKYCGENVNIEPRTYFNPELEIGDNSGIGMYSEMHGAIRIGNNVMMGHYCLFYSRNHAHNRTDIPMINQGFEEVRPVIIGNDVWIGSRVTILPGVHIGNGCVLAAGSVITKDAPPNTIIAGNPAKVVKQRDRND